ncbi:MAG: UDPGP type 1 family protein [Lachnospiraceae bacterium]|nr:UDPGP type 1 family protein [Lachnospiraceae bacterium]
MTYEQAYRKLEAAGQTGLLRFYQTLTRREQKELLSEIEALDLSVLSVLGTSESTETAFQTEPLSALTVPEINERRAEFEKAGIEAIRAGKTAAVLLAGGQGTRLGFDHPKGMYPIGVTHDLYIFECLFRNLKKTMDAAGAPFWFFIMTSAINDRETRAFFEEHAYFGYPKEYVRFFIQDMAPCTDFDGKVLLSAPGHVALSPNGNGGWYHSLKKAGLDRVLAENGVEYISCFAVDNVLQQINDPAFVGATVLSGADVGAKVIRKANPTERVGVLCTKNGHPSIVEYYEITEEMKTLRDENGDLLYNFGVILNYLFKVSKLEEIIAKRMPIHIAKKKIPYVNDRGELVKPEEPNGNKYELLVLDMIELMDTCLPYEVVREKEFAPVKNPTGVDSVESARALLELNGVVL